MRSALIMLAFLFSTFDSFSQSARELCEAVFVSFHVEGDSLVIKVLAPAANLLGYADRHSMGMIEIMDAAEDTTVDNSPFMEFSPIELQGVIGVEATVCGTRHDFYVKFSFWYSDVSYVFEIRGTGEKKLKLAEQN